MMLIPLSQDKFTKVDDEDFVMLSQWKWSLSNGYATRRLRRLYIEGEKPKQRDQKMHRLLLGEPDGQVDHINCDRLDNRKINLRVVTIQQNRCNRGKTIKNSTGYKGVGKRGARWLAQIKAKNKPIFLGYFSCPEDAARAYDSAALNLHGDYANLNFPEGSKI